MNWLRSNPFAAYAFASYALHGPALPGAVPPAPRGGLWLAPRRPTKSEIEAALMVVLLAEEADE